jgi:predicted permease
MSSFTQDLRLAFRVFAKNPAFTAIAVSALALGIGANTAIFSVVNGVLLEPLPFKNADRIMRVARKYPDGRGDAVSIPKFTTWKQQNSVFEYMAAYDLAGPGFNLSGGDVPEQIKGIHVSSEFFPLFGASPLFGRTFTAEEDRPGGPRLAVVSHGLWKRRFGGDPNFIGKPMTLNGEPYTVIGVLSERFYAYPPADIWVPLQADPSSTNQGHYLFSAGLLKPGVSVETASANMKVVGEQFRRANPKWMNKEEGVAVVPLQESMVGNTRPALLVLIGAVGFVLLIACANVANLLLARAASRSKEIAIRTALGAGRWRLVRQLLTESVLLASFGGILGLLIGLWGQRALLAVSPGDIPRVAEMTAGSMFSNLDIRVLGFTIAVSLFTGIVFGLVPALQLSKPDLNSTLKESSSRSTTGRRHYARSALVVIEMMLALVLLVSAGLLIQTFRSLRSVNPGFDLHNVLTLQTSLNGANYASTALVESLTLRLLERIESVPGVTAATSSINVPLEGGVDLPFSIEGKQPTDGSQYNGDEQWRYAAPHYFDVLKVPVLRGRAFTRQDSGKAPRVVIINEAFAKRYWPNEDPIGRRITIGKGLGPEFEDPPRQIVGIVGSVREGGLDSPPTPVLYVPFGQVADGITQLANRALPTAWMIRTAGDPRNLVKAIQQEFLAVDRQLPVARIRTLEDVLSDATARQNFNMLLLTIFAGLALLLAAIGIYGVMSYAVEQRTHEIGIRMALGAGTSDMLRLVVGQGMLLAAIGVIAGLLASFALTRLFTRMLYGIKPTDPLTFAAMAVVLSFIAFLACYIPARRATKVDPVIALRYE